MATRFTFDAEAFLADFPDLDRALREVNLIIQHKFTVTLDRHGDAVQLLNRVARLSEWIDAQINRRDSLKARREQIEAFLGKLEPIREADAEDAKEVQRFEQETQRHLNFLEDKEGILKNFTTAKALAPVQRAAQISLVVEILALYASVEVDPGHLLNMMEERKEGLQIVPAPGTKTCLRDLLKNSRSAISKDLREYYYNKSGPYGEGFLFKHTLSRLTAFYWTLDSSPFSCAIAAFCDPRKPIPGIDY